MNLRDHLFAAIDETLDKMAFMSFSAAADAAVAADAAAAASPFAYTVRLGFRGKVTGELTLYFTEKTAVAMSRNLLGLRDGDELFPGTKEDALKEFANILMGRSLSLLDPSTPFTLQIPEARPGNIQAAPPSADSLEIRGMFDDYEPCRLVIGYR